MVKHIVCDIEGTTTPIDFVYKTLFPYARAHLRNFIFKAAREQHQEALNYIHDVQTTIHSSDSRSSDQASASSTDFSKLVIRNEVSTPVESNIDLPAVAQTLLEWMDKDLKLTPLKKLQGLIWQAGYESGELRSALYPDVRPSFVRWQENYKIHTSIYSSGSVAAQKLLFRYSTDGDLRPLLHCYFDTEVGPKQSADSYRMIAQTLAADPGSILFLSDRVVELEAASQAGWETGHIVRPGTERSTKYQPLTDFEAVDFLLRALHSSQNSSSNT